jgi:soluble lytic murein transglycosylase
MKKRIFVALFSLFFITGCTLPISLATAAPVSITPSEIPSPTVTPTPTATPIPQPSDHLHNGDAAWFNGDDTTALDEYQQALNQSTDPSVIPAALFGIGRIYAVKQDCVTAMDAFNQLVSQYSSSKWTVPTYYYAAQCYEANNNFAQAINAFDGFLQLKPGVIDDTILELKGDALFNASDYAGAVSAYSASLAANPPADFDSTQVKIGKTYAAEGDRANAIKTFLDLYNSTLSDYTKATCDLLMGQAYLALGETDQANTRFLDAVNNYPKSYDSYSALVQLVNSNITVNDFNRGLVDFYAGQYYPAIDALIRYINADVKHPGSAHYYLGLSYFYTDQTDLAIQQYDSLITDHPNDKDWPAAWDEKAYIQWNKNSKYADAAKTLLDYVALEPGSAEAPGYLFEAARIYERGNLLPEAAANWERLINEYPSADNALRGLFLSGITYYRMGQFDRALQVFQHYWQLATDPSTQAAAYFWEAKTALATGDMSVAASDWNFAIQADPGGYYSIRAAEILKNDPPLQASTNYDLGFDLNYDRIEAEAWLRSRFSIPQDLNLTGLGDLSGNIHLERGDLYWQMGLLDAANAEFETLRNDLKSDAVNSYRLLNYFMDIGLYRSAILTSRQILDLAGLNDAASLQAPIFFNHIRFGPYYRDLVTAYCSTYDMNPLLIFSLIRQESFFESFIRSSAGAMGLMQMMPATGQEKASDLGWPAGYQQSDLFRPTVNVLFGVSYLSGQQTYFNGDLYAAVAAYNAGAGNVQIWMSLANNDPDLFLEVVRFDETRTYLQQITEFLAIYRALYER